MLNFRIKGRDKGQCWHLFQRRYLLLSFESCVKAIDLPTKWWKRLKHASIGDVLLEMSSVALVYAMLGT